VADSNDDRWCVVTTNSRRTLGLAASFASAGIEAWTPRQMCKRQIPVRGRAARTAPQYREIEEPIMPGFLFVRAHHLPDLLRALAQPINPHPAFSIFQLSRGAPLIKDAEIKGLREREARAKHAVRKDYALPVGHKIRLDTGPLAGLDGIVVEASNKATTIVFNRLLRIKIDTFQLLTNAVEVPAVSGLQDGQQTNRLRPVAGAVDPAPFCVGRAA
jgi:transcription antitermination factor NusG